MDLLTITMFAQGISSDVSMIQKEEEDTSKVLQAFTVLECQWKPHKGIIFNAVEMYQYDKF